MPQGWKPTRIGDICKTNQQTYSLSEKWPFVNYLDTGNITENRISEIQHLVTGQDTLPSRARRKVAVDDILYSTVRPNQRHYGIVKEVLPNMLVSTGFAVITADKSVADSDFLYYYLTQKEIVDSLHAIGEQSVSAYPSIKPSDIEGLELMLPPLYEQHEIGRTLRALDDKIANNTMINHHLEQMAQAIYADFVASVDGATMKLKELCAFQEGYVNPSQSRTEYFDGAIKWLRAVDINESFIFDTSRTLTDCGFGSAGKSAYLFKPNTIAISKSGTIGRLGFVADFMCGNRAVINISPNNTRILPFVYLYLKSRQTEYPDLAVGSVQKNLYVPILQELDILVPEESVLLEFCDSVAPLFEQWKNNVAENRTLSQTRDALLPRLMSGELSVADHGNAK
ncbi:restriction endonuclease subunit S [Desulforamulus ruminis]|uniref:Restriction modification system DNA specificity domain protein n=1 Tax=Desulforamulus ruminis (strain ATCC 23193 / DSM 2154 / NCIMB 8452 / DL) TaxID=696281 RepID=F6DN97_DESRL|nr:restriction endonuclease subunit S [Desulforamulus ruminis]AEG61788.1 restriction modification system DNA specificity domain protein [Desulforamulus ruminis DSM 2154]